MWRSATRVSARVHSSAAAALRLPMTHQQRAASNLALRSTVWVPTEKEVPADAAIPSHQLLIRGGFIRKSGHGVFTFLPLGKRVVSKLEAIIDDEMAAIRGNKLDLPLLIPAELWEQSGRWQTRGPELMTLADRRGVMHALAPTHEESITSLVAQHFTASSHAGSLRLYQVGKKFRDEIRPRFGLLRAREFVMKDMYSFDTSVELAHDTYDDVVRAYSSILTARLKLPIAKVEADSGNIGGSLSHEFHVVADIGEDALLSCASATCDYAANVEKAVGALPAAEETATAEAPAVSDELIQALAHIEAIAAAGDRNAWKALVELAAPVNGAQLTAQVLREQHVTGAAASRVAVVLARRDREVNALSLKSFFGGEELEVVDAVALEALDLQTLASADASDAEPQLSIFIDDSLEVAEYAGSAAAAAAAAGDVAQLVNDVARAHEALGLVRVARGHFRVAQHGDGCPRCAASALEAKRGIEVGHVFYLGRKYSKPFNVTSPDAANGGAPRVMEMGCFGMGVTRLIASAVEVSHDVRGIIWPAAIAPYQVIVLAIGATDGDAPLAQTATAIAHDLAAVGSGGVGSGLDVMLDDRWRESPGSKLAESELLGYPFRVVVGKRFAADGVVEVQTRATLDKVFLAPSELKSFFADKAALGEL